MKYLPLYIVLICLLSACGQQEQQAESRLYQEVMDIHDEAMARMGELMQLRQQLSDSSSLQLQEATASRQQSQQHLDSLRQGLADADEAMMNWMREFQPELDSLTHEQKMNYLEQEKKKIQQVKTEMDEAIQQAEKALN